MKDLKLEEQQAGLIGAQRADWFKYGGWGLILTEEDKSMIDTLSNQVIICPFHNVRVHVSIGWYHYKLECYDCLLEDTIGGYNHYNREVIK